MTRLWISFLLLRIVYAVSFISDISKLKPANFNELLILGVSPWFCEAFPHSVWPNKGRLENAIRIVKQNRVAASVKKARKDLLRKEAVPVARTLSSLRIRTPRNPGRFSPSGNYWTMPKRESRRYGPCLHPLLANPRLGN